jgi:hypothetical protein
VAQFVQSRLHRGCFCDRMSATVRRHEDSVTPV